MNFKNTVRLDVAGVFLFLFLISGVVTSHAQGVITAEFPVTENVSGLGSFNSGNRRIAQTFTTLEAGFLSTISVALAPDGTGTIPGQISIEFLDTFSGAPLPAESGFVQSSNGSALEGATFQNPVFLEVDFSSQGIFLESNAQYAFALRAVGQGAPWVFTDDFFLVNYYDDGAPFESEDFGQTWSEIENADIFFRVTVVPVPEPSTWVLLSAGLVAVLLSRKVLKRQN